MKSWFKRSSDIVPGGDLVENVNVEKPEPPKKWHSPKKIVCRLCNKAFNNGRSNSLSHAKIHLQKDEDFNPYFCRICPPELAYQTAFLTKLNNHIKTAHRRDKYVRPGVEVPEEKYNEIVERKIIECFGFVPMAWKEKIGNK